MYLLVKTSENKVKEEGSLFEAARGHWKLDPDHAKQCSHVVVGMLGHKDIKAVYTIDGIYPSTLVDGRYVFSGDTDKQLESQLVGKQFNKRLTAKGSENPIMYVKENELLAV